MEFVCESTGVREFDPAATSRAIAAVLSGQSDGCIIQGDCLRVLPLIPGGSIPMIFTDPPYGHNNAQNDLIAGNRPWQTDATAAHRKRWPRLDAPRGGRHAG